MVSFMVIEIRLDGSPQGLGRHEFHVAPIIGDTITHNDDKGIGQAYLVVARAMALDPASNAGDLFIRRVGTDTEFRMSLKSK